MSVKKLGNFSVKSVGFAITSLVVSLSIATPAQSSTFTRTSLTSWGLLPDAVSEVGGIVLDLIGTNGTRVVTQLAASGLYQGVPNTPFTIGTQSGFDPAVIAALGNGISQASVRVSLFDGDSAAGEFDFNENTLLLNGITFGNFSDVNAVNTDATGVETAEGFSGGGFRNQLFDTGFFFSNDASTLANLFTSLSSGNVVFGVNDITPRSNFYDFNDGVDVGVGPIVSVNAPTAAVPEPFTIIGTLIGGTAALRMRKKLKSTTKV